MNLFLICGFVDNGVALCGERSEDRHQQRGYVRILGGEHVEKQSTITHSERVDVISDDQQ